ncbi:MAG: hypothetical protein OXU77_14865 [Gammaproteobacteria bacterium]|nr:hypothetical protein [Gammaproteobacteria bacterium]
MGVCDESVGPQNAIPNIVLICDDAKPMLAELCGSRIDFYRIEVANPYSAMAAGVPDGI